MGDLDRSIISPGAAAMIRIAIADDHAIVRKGLRQIIAETNDLAVTGEAASDNELFILLRAHSFDVLVLDLTLGTRDGIDLLKYVRSEFPQLHVLILSMHAEDLFAVRALRAGACGYVEKDSAPEELVAAIRRIATGRRYVSPSMAERLAGELVHRPEMLPHERLSDREFEIFRLLGVGRSVTEIAHLLNISVKTVSSHRTRILIKTGLGSNADIVSYAHAHHLH